VFCFKKSGSQAGFTQQNFKLARLKETKNRRLRILWTVGFGRTTHKPDFGCRAWLPMRFYSYLVHFQQLAGVLPFKKILF
jgi:hypothetical protein